MPELVEPSRASSRPALAVLAKAPEAGKVKTRMTLGPDALRPADAARVQEAFLEDITQRDHGDRFGDRVLWSKGDQASPIWGRAQSRGWRLEVQPSDDLGRNILTAIDACHGPCIVLGTDSPDVPNAHLDDAVRSLETTDVVLGPSLDGGYYLIGTRRPFAQLFAGVSWGSDTVFAETVERVFASGLSVHVLPYWYDVDSVADLRRLRLHSTLPPGPCSAHPPLATLRLTKELGG